MANLMVGNAEMERSPVTIPYGVDQCTQFSVPIVELVGGTGLIHSKGNTLTTSTPYLDSRGALKVAVMATGDALYWTIPLYTYDLNFPLTFGLGFTSNTAAAAGKTFLPTMTYQVLTPGASGGSTAALTGPPSPANSPDQAFGAQKLLAQDTWEWTGTGATQYTGGSYQPAIVNSANLVAYQNYLSWLNVKIAVGSFTAGLTDLAITHLFITGVPLITPTPSPGTINEQILLA